MRLCKSNIDVDLSDSENVFDDLSGNTNESNIDYTYPSSCAEAHEEPEKERPVSQKKTTNTFLMNERKWNYNL